ncbi:MAG: hypothetical protein IT405_02635 [Candidatus Yanofskybacteria bacterium]|nr:hypothetical protein [Candidatus Yanofskybacteria bacterium]
MFVLISDDSSTSKAAERFLRLRGIRFERATEQFAGQFAGCARPSVVVGARLFEGISGVREAVEQNSMQW